MWYWWEKVNWRYKVYTGGLSALKGTWSSYKRIQFSPTTCIVPVFWGQMTWFIYLYLQESAGDPPLCNFFPGYAWLLHVMVKRKHLMGLYIRCWYILTSSTGIPILVSETRGTKQYILLFLTTTGFVFYCWSPSSSQMLPINSPLSLRS